ncbi:acetyl-CoA carboxylase biotin carboxyl carrier protein [Lachnospiraceae bacterium 62-26]
MEIENLIKLIEKVSESSLTGLKYEENGVKLHLTKKKEQVQVVAAPAVNIPDGMTAAAAGCAAGYGMDQAGTAAAAANEAAGSLAGADAPKPAGKLVESPLVGTFYAAPAEDAAPFVTVGDTVKKGQTLAIIEAMKLMNEIESEYDGTIAEVLVENGQPVEYGQPLFRIN